MKFLLLVSIFALQLPTVAQTDSAKQRKVKVKKNLRYYFQPMLLKNVARSNKFDFQIDTRNSFVKDFPINVYGVNVGLVRRERLRYGIGYYWINQNFNNKLLGIYSSGEGAKTGRVIVSPKGIPIPTSILDKLVEAYKLDPYIKAAQQIDLWFASFGFMYTFYAGRLVELAIPVEIGYGNFSESLYDISGGNFSSLGTSLKPGVTKGNFIPGQIGFDILLKPHRWIYFEGSLGYRKTLTQNYTSKYRATNLDSQFDGEYYNVGVKIQIGTIYKEIRSGRKPRISEISIKE